MQGLGLFILSPYLTVSTSLLAMRFLLFNLKTQILLIPQIAGSGTSEHCQALEDSLVAFGSDRTRKACNFTQSIVKNHRLFFQKANKNTNFKQNRPQFESISKKQCLYSLNSYIYVYECSFGHVCMRTCVPDVCRGQKRALDPLDLELKNGYKPWTDIKLKSI